MPRKKTTAVEPVDTAAAVSGDTAEKQPEVAQQDAPKKRTAKTTPKPRVRKQLDTNMYVLVRNGFHGQLNYHDSAADHQWSEFGDELEVTLGTLQRARASHRRFFEENWFLIDDPEVIEYLGVEKFYKNALSYEEFDELFDMDTDAIKERVKLLSRSQKHGVAYRAKQKIESGELYNLNTIRALEKALGTDLIEK